MRSLILLLLLGCFSAFGQEKITDFAITEIRNEKLLPVGKMGDYFYTITPDLGISRIHTATRELSLFLTLPEAANRSFDAVIAGNQLYFYDNRIDSNRVTVYRVNVADASYQKVLTIPDARAVIKNGDFLYVTGSAGLKQVDLNQGLRLETLLPEGRVEGDVKPYSLFELKDSLGKRISRVFLDADHRLHPVTTEVNGPFTGQDCGDFVLFSRQYNSDRYYYYNKENGDFKPLFITGKGLLTRGVLSEVMEIDGRYFVVHNYIENVLNEIKSYISLHELIGGELHEIFTEQVQLFTYYNSAPGAAGIFAPVLYSNFIGKEGKIFFWASSSLQAMVGFHLQFNTIDIDKKELKSVPLDHEDLFNRMNRQRGWASLCLSWSPDGVYTHNLRDDRVNFEYVTATGNFREADVYAPVNVHSVSADLQLNFTYPNQVIAHRGNGQQQVLKLETPVKRSPVDEVTHYRDEIIFTGRREHRVHIFDGKEVKSHKLEFADDFKLINFWHLTPASERNFMLLGVHGVRADDVEGGHLYVVDKTTFHPVKVKTFEAGFNTDPFHISGPSGPRALVCVNGTDYAYTDYSPGNTVFFQDQALGQWATLIHAFNDQAAVLKNHEEIFYYNFKTRTKTFLTWVASGNTDRVYHNRVFFTYKSDLYFAGPEGNKTLVAKAGNTFFDLVEETENFLVYRKPDAIGFLNKYSAKYAEFKISGESVTTYVDFYGIPYVFTNSEILRLDIDQGRKETIHTNIKEIVRPTVFGNRILFHEAYPPEYKQSTLWCLEDGKLRVLMNELDLNGDGHHALNRPEVFRDRVTLNHAFWIPEKEKVFYFTGHDFSDNQYVSYWGTTNGYHYFQSHNYRLNKKEFFIFNVATEEFKALVLEMRDLSWPVSFQENIYYASADAVWRVAGTGQEVRADLVSTRVMGTDLFAFKNNLYVWAEDENRIPQVYRLTDNESKEEADVLLSAENPALNFSFYPNPVQNYLNITASFPGPARYKVSLISTDGKVVSEKESELPYKLDFSGLRSGIYLINISSVRESRTFKIVKN